LIEGFKYIDVDYITLYDHNDKYFYEMYADLVSKNWMYSECTLENNTKYHKYICVQRKHTAKRFRHTRKYCDIQKGLTRDFDKFRHLTREGKTLINSIPGYSTHCEPKYIGPVVNWEDVYNKTCNYF
jgi:ribosomal protein S17E